VGTLAGRGGSGRGEEGGSGERDREIFFGRGRGEGRVGGREGRSGELN